MPTLDIAEDQVLIDFYDDPNGFFWHHRVLVRSLGSGIWIGFTPTLSVQRIDLNEHRIIVLPRNGNFPQDRIQEVFACDPADFGDGVLANLRNEVNQLASVLGGGPAPTQVAPGGTTWRVSDSCHKLFAEEVPAAALANPEIFIQRGSFALVEIDSELTTAQVESPEDGRQDGFRRRLTTGHGRDVRLLGDERDSDGRRFLSFAAILSLVKEASFEFWPIQGPRSVRDYINAIRQLGAGGFLEFHADWVKTSGVGEKSGSAREHRFLLDLLRLMVQWDQLDATSLASAELVVRRLVQIELAVKKNPKTPDYGGLEGLLESAVDGSGAAVLPKLSQWLGEHQKNEAFVLKQMRLWSEEQEVAKKRTKDPK